MTGGMEKPLDRGKLIDHSALKRMTYNNRAWMTFCFMDVWLRAYNARTKQHNCHVLLFLGSVMYHACVGLCNVQVVWFPQNTTSVSQPIGEGVIQCI